MRWSAFLILAWLLLSIQTGLEPLLRLHDAAPSLLLILAVHVGLAAPARIVAFTFLALGLLTDLTVVYGAAGGAPDLVLVGPHALGYLLGAWVVLQFRGMVYRDSPLGLAVMVFLAGMFIYPGAVFLVALRRFPWPLGEIIEGWTATDALVSRFFDLLYTVVIALPLAYLLARLDRLLALESGHGSHGKR